jgi:hypothetical protein
MTGVALATIAYWVEFFTSGRVRTSDDSAYVDFERAFPLADAYMAGAFLLAARNLRRQRIEAVPTGIAAGSAMVFLGGMDLLYNLQHRKFADRTPEMAVETAIVAFSLGFGPLTMVRMWRARQRLAG